MAKKKISTDKDSTENLKRQTTIWQDISRRQLWKKSMRNGKRKLAITKKP